MAARPLNHGGSEKAKFTELNNLCSEKHGAAIVFATDDWFAAAENLLKESEAEWKEGVFDDYGKWMDGWETRRKRIPGHDWAIIKLSSPGVIHGVDVNTAFFTGNNTPKMSIQAARIEPQEKAATPRSRRGNGKAATKAEFDEVDKLNSIKWTTIVKNSKLGPGYIDTCHNYFEVESRETWTHLRLNMYPDGGIARLRVYGQVQRDLKDIIANNSCGGLVDLIAMENGGICIGYSDAHYGHPRNMIQKPSSINMGDGWETARRLDRPEILVADSQGVLQVPGTEWAAFRLGVPGDIKKVEILTTHFKGNFPDSCTIEVCNMENLKKETEMVELNGAPWKRLLPAKKMKADSDHTYSEEIEKCGDVTHVRIRMAPDGGVARLRIWGTPKN